MQGKCPACHTVAMVPHQDHGTALEIDCCPECCGLWFDADELRQFYASAELKEQYMPSRTYKPENHTFEITTKPRKCPRCPVALTRTQVGDIYVDVCPKCSGVWLDDGELDRLTFLYKERGLRGDARVTDQVRAGNEVKVRHTGAVHDVLESLGSMFTSFLKLGQ
jgi:Zn-finger nucleic acid-binding protein